MGTIGGHYLPRLFDMNKRLKRRDNHRKHLCNTTDQEIKSLTGTYKDSIRLLYWWHKAIFKEKIGPGRAQRAARMQVADFIQKALKESKREALPAKRSSINSWLIRKLGLGAPWMGRIQRSSIDAQLNRQVSRRYVAGQSLEWQKSGLIKCYVYANYL